MAGPLYGVVAVRAERAVHRHRDPGLARGRRGRRAQRARHMFHFSLLYLFLIFAVLLADRVAAGA